VTSAVGRKVWSCEHVLGADWIKRRRLVRVRGPHDFVKEFTRTDLG
jgi:hypothetical protein